MTRPTRVSAALTVAVAVVSGLTVAGCSSSQQAPDGVDAMQALSRSPHSLSTPSGPTEVTPGQGVSPEKITADAKLTSEKADFSAILSSRTYSGIEVSETWALGWREGMVVAASLVDDRVRGYGDTDSDWIIREATATDNSLYVREFNPDKASERIVEVDAFDRTRIIAQNDSARSHFSLVTYDGTFYYFAPEYGKHDEARYCANTVENKDLTCIEGDSIHDATPAFDGISVNVDLPGNAEGADFHNQECHAPGFFNPAANTLAIMDFDGCGAQGAATSHSALWSFQPSEVTPSQGYVEGGYWLAGKQEVIENMQLNSPLSCNSRLTFTQRRGSEIRHVWLRADGRAQVIETGEDVDNDASRLLCADDGRWVFKTDEQYFIEGSAEGLDDRFAELTDYVETVAGDTPE